MMHLIDRRLNGRGKSAQNRERFLRRYKAHIRTAVQRIVARRSIADMADGAQVSIPSRDIAEPSFRHGAGGDREMVAPGNRDYARGDTLRRPQGGAGRGAGGSGEGEGVDEFAFSLSREEFLNIFFEDLELPRLARNMLGKVEKVKPARAGYTTEGAPSNLSVVRTLQTALGRRIALAGVIGARIDGLRAEIEAGEENAADGERRAALEAELEALTTRHACIPFLDALDLRYRNRVQTPAPAARAVMFCLMDVSASMDEAKKDIAKRFYSLLYLFLSQKYEHVEVVFVRHTERAEEVSEDAFFNDPVNGGTVVMSALELMRDIVAGRYPAAGWNVYAAQASDGDAFGADPQTSARFLEDSLLPLTRYFAYIEVAGHDASGSSPLWAHYETVRGGEFAMHRVNRREDIYPVFRELFRKEA